MVIYFFSPHSITLKIIYDCGNFISESFLMYCKPDAVCLTLCALVYSRVWAWSEINFCNTESFHNFDSFFCCISIFISVVQSPAIYYDKKC